MSLLVSKVQSKEQSTVEDILDNTCYSRVSKRSEKIVEAALLSRIH